MAMPVKIEPGLEMVPGVLEMPPVKLEQLQNHKLQCTTMTCERQACNKVVGHFWQDTAGQFHYHHSTKCHAQIEHDLHNPMIIQLQQTIAVQTQQMAQQQQLMDQQQQLMDQQQQRMDQQQQLMDQQQQLILQLQGNYAQLNPQHNPPIHQGNQFQPVNAPLPAQPSAVPRNPAQTGTSTGVPQPR